MTPSESKLAAQPAEIGGYEVIRPLADGQSWLTTAPGGRLMVLKSLDDDCLWKGQLHPNIKDRLGRVRELAHVGVANLYGVERDGALSFLVWEYVHGESLDEFATVQNCPPRELLSLARELVLSVEMLHARGIVHGAIKPSNIIIDSDRSVQLTHVSPWLYTEPGEDVQALLALLTDLSQRRGESEGALARMLEEQDPADWTLRRLASRLGALLDAREGEAYEDTDKGAARRIRRRATLGATATVVLALAVFVGLRQYANQKTPRPPVPPQATPAALQPVSTSQGPSGDTTGIARVDRRRIP